MGDKKLIYIEYTDMYIIVNGNDMHIYNTYSIISQHIFVSLSSTIFDLRQRCFFLLKKLYAYLVDKNFVIQINVCVIDISDIVAMEKMYSFASQ